MMFFCNKHIILFKFTCLFFLYIGLIKVGIAKPTIKKLTSDNMANKVSKDISTIELSSDIKKRHSIGLGLGETYLGGDFKENGEKSINMDLFYSYIASYSYDAIVNLHYSYHKKNDSNVYLPGVAFGLKSRVYQIDNLAPFLLGGLGFYSPYIRYYDNGEHRRSESNITMGFHLGTGMDLKLNDKGMVGFLAHYHQPFKIKQEATSDIRGLYFKLLITLSYFF